MSRGVNVSLLVPVILGLVIAVLLYFCWGTRSLSHRLREEVRGARFVYEPF